MYRLMTRAFLFTALLLLQACATKYLTPGSGVNISSLIDEGGGALSKEEPTINYPVNLLVIRLQDKDYYTLTNDGVVADRFSIITEWDIEDATDLKRIEGLDGVASVAPLRRSLFSSTLSSMSDLRQLASTLNAGLMLVYSVDTQFHIDGKLQEPLSELKLGPLQSKRVRISSTTSGALIDVQTGFVYGIAESFDQKEKKSSSKSTESVIDGVRLESEATSYRGFIAEFLLLWDSLRAQYVRG